MCIKIPTFFNFTGRPINVTLWYVLFGMFSRTAECQLLSGDYFTIVALRICLRSIAVSPSSRTDEFLKNTKLSPRGSHRFSSFIVHSAIYSEPPSPFSIRLFISPCHTSPLLCWHGPSSCSVFLWLPSIECAWVSYSGGYIAMSQVHCADAIYFVFVLGSTVGLYIGYTPASSTFFSSPPSQYLIIIHLLDNYPRS